MESDEEIRRVPEVGLELAGPSTSGREATAAAVATAGTSSASQAASAARRRGRSPADKEHRRLKRWVAFSRLFVSCGLVGTSMIAEDMLIFIQRKRSYTITNYYCWLI